MKLQQCLGVAVVVYLLPLLGPRVLGQPAPQSSRSAQEDDIREAVLRYQMQNWIRELDADEANATNQSEKESAEYFNFKFFFVSTGEKDPSDEFVKRFQDLPRIVKKESLAGVDKDLARLPVIDKETRQRGIIFSVDQIGWRGRNHAKVEGGYHCNLLCGAGYTFDVRYEKGKWVVKKQRMDWIS